MSDAEREVVGTCYKEQGQDKAIILGHELVQGEVKEARVQAWLDFARQNPDGYLYCARGGLRSQIAQQWLAEAGCQYPRITGGYKALRRFLIDRMDAICEPEPFVLLAGQTGAAKTDLLLSLNNSIDLEGLAHHRGSAFGKRAGGQPSQIGFENALAIDLLRLEHRLRANGKKQIVLEDESPTIGRCALPLTLRDTMARAPLVVLDVDLEQRVEHTFHNYILLKLEEWLQFQGPEQGFDSFAQELLQSLANIRRRLGGERYQQFNDILVQAIAEHRRGDNALHREWIRPLLRDYYDPQYNYHLNLREERVLFRGDRDGVQAYCQQLS
jgi:tRNA 2-selenouridine synthase